MEETFLLDLQECELSEGRKWKILDQIIDLDYKAMLRLLSRRYGGIEFGMDSKYW